MSRERIVANIKRNKPSAVSLPEIPVFQQPVENLAAAFELTSTNSGSRVFSVEHSAQLDNLITDLFPTAELIAAPAKQVTLGTVEVTSIKNPLELQHVDIAVIDGLIGVAENGAVWVTEREMAHRVLPFIAQHLILIVPNEQLVWNMHEAYQRIQVNETGFGVFIAGPSKTADIEQSLVIGAQGARSLTVVLVNSR